MLRKLWQHSIGCAFTAGWLSKRLDFGVMQNEAFFSGLFHDVGKLLILVVIEKKRKKDKSIKINNELLLGAMELLHPEQGALMVRELGMPGAQCDIVREHHQTDFDKDNYLLVLVRMANHVCHAEGIGMKHEPELALLETPEAEILNLSEEDILDLQSFLRSTPSLAE
jgi:putative nucleotidyltransferase with HDIG domain